jgi:hypothetical protein
MRDTAGHGAACVDLLQFHENDLLILMFSRTLWLGSRLRP